MLRITLKVVIMRIMLEILVPELTGVDELEWMSVEFSQVTVPIIVVRSKKQLWNHIAGRRRCVYLG